LPDRPSLRRHSPDVGYFFGGAMSMELCSQCHNLIDTDKRLDGEYIGLRYVCEWCVEMRDAEEYINRMRQVAHEGT
jgi:hypothetical protein